MLMKSVKILLCPCCAYIYFLHYIALAVLVQSPVAYEALKSFNVLQLLSRATLQAYTGAFLYEAGVAAESISK